MAYTFDCVNKIVQLDDTSPLDMQDLYSRWKDELLADDMVAGCDQAFRVVREVLEGTDNVGPYYFTMNDWQIRPNNTAYELVVTGTVVQDETSTDPVFKTDDLTAVVIITNKVAVNVLTKETGISGLTAGESAQLLALPTKEEIAQEVIEDFTF